MNQSKTKFVILGLLSEQSLTGYDIRKIVDIRFSFFWNESYGQIYPVLKKLSEEKLVLAEKSKDDSKRERISYSITKKGTIVLKNWLTEPVETESMRLEILLKMYFSNMTTREVMQAHIGTFEENHKKQLELLNLFESQLKKVEDQDNHQEVLQVLSLGQKVNQAYLEWCQETQVFLSKRRDRS